MAEKKLAIVEVNGIAIAQRSIVRV